VERALLRRDVRVLVVEDDSDLGDALCLLLEQEGFRPHWAANGKVALEHLRGNHEPVDIIVLDLRMPVMNGWEFRLEQKKDRLLSKIPVVAISADLSPQALSIDADAVLQKPLDGNALIATLKRLLQSVHVDDLSVQQQWVAMGQLASGVAHEINNPLSFMISNLKLLDEIFENGEKPPELQLPREELQSLIRETSEGAHRIARIVKDMQVFSSMRSESPEVTDLRSIVETVLNMAAPTLRKKAQIVRGYEQPVWVMAPPARLAQLFMHLILNAADAMRDGDSERQKLTVRLRSEGCRSVAEVIDTGGGIAPQMLERVFDPFFTTKKTRGRGMGLYVCKSIVSQLRGELMVESRIGEGSTFRIDFPTPSVEEH
jgi:two-component system NtrC family sensor kinase